MSRIVSAPRVLGAQRWVSWDSSDLGAGLFGWVVTLGLISHQWGPLFEDSPAWSVGLVIHMVTRLVPAAVIVVVLFLLGLELGIPLWAPWRLVTARRTLAIRESPPALIHGTGFWPATVRRVYPRDEIARVILEVTSVEQHLRQERYADYAQIVLYRPGHRLPKVLLHRSRVPAVLEPPLQAIGQFLSQHPVSPDSPPPEAKHPAPAPPPSALQFDEIEA